MANIDLKIFKPKSVYIPKNNDTATACYKQDEHYFPAKFFLSLENNCFVNSFHAKEIYSTGLLDYLNEKGKLIYFSGDQYNFYYNDSVVIVNVDEAGSKISIFYPSDANATLEEYRQFIITDKKSRVSILTKGSYGLETTSIKIEPPKIPQLDLNYGSGFKETHEKILSKLNNESASIMFFHGAPGCGKSYYIKYLSSLIDKEFIFVPIAYAGELASPDFITLLLEHKDSIIILEDAEKVVQSRELDDNNVSTVSTLLNLSDGILGSLLNIKIIATYNGDKSLVDKALLRPGRLAIDHTFGKLSADESNMLALSLGKPSNYDTPQSLAEIYNAGDDTGYKEKVVKRMGFGG